jgi:hypothetical protein
MPAGSGRRGADRAQSRRSASEAVCESSRPAPHARVAAAWAMASGCSWTGPRRGAVALHATACGGWGYHGPPAGRLGISWIETSTPSRSDADICGVRHYFWRCIRKHPARSLRSVRMRSVAHVLSCMHLVRRVRYASHIIDTGHVDLAMEHACDSESWQDEKKKKLSAAGMFRARVHVD